MSKGLCRMGPARTLRVGSPQGRVLTLLESPRVALAEALPTALPCWRLYPRLRRHGSRPEARRMALPLVGSCRRAMEEDWRLHLQQQLGGSEVVENWGSPPDLRGLEGCVGFKIAPP